jgi:hypothetical protein
MSTDQVPCGQRRARTWCRIKWSKEGWDESETVTMDGQEDASAHHQHLSHSVALGIRTRSLRICLKKGIQNPSRVPHELNSVRRACAVLATGGLLVCGLVFPKVGFHLTKRRGILSTRKHTLGWQPGASETMLSGSGPSEVKYPGHWSSCWGARKSNCSVDMGLIGSAIRKWNLTFCHEAASRCRMPPEGDPPETCLVMLVRYWP